MNAAGSTFVGCRQLSSPIGSAANYQKIQLTFFFGNLGHHAVSYLRQTESQSPFFRHWQAMFAVPFNHLA
jgi:hypothetical protein